METIKRTILVGIVAFSAIIIQSCGEDEKLPTDAQASFEMRAVTGTSTATAGRTTNSDYSYTEVFAGVTEIELETLEEDMDEEENGESENEEVEFEGNFVINLLTGTSNPDFGLSELLAGVYQEIEIAFDNILEGNKTFIVNFNFTPEGSNDTTFVEFSTSEELELEIENEAGFILDEGAVNAILVTLDLDVLFGSLNYDNLKKDDDGVIRINENTNSDVMQSIVEKLEVALEAEEEEEDEEGEGEEDEDD